MGTGLLIGYIILGLTIAGLTGLALRAVWTEPRVKSLFTGKPYFTGSPEMFLALMIDLERQGRENDPSSASAEQLAGVFTKVMVVNLRPYKSFAELQQNGEPDYTVAEQSKTFIQAIRSRREIKKAIYGENVDLGDDDVMHADNEGARFARKMAKEMSRHVRFKEEE